MPETSRFVLEPISVVMPPRMEAKLSTIIDRLGGAPPRLAKVCRIGMKMTTTGVLLSTPPMSSTASREATSAVSVRPAGNPEQGPRTVVERAGLRKALTHHDQTEKSDQRRIGEPREQSARTEQITAFRSRFREDVERQQQQAHHKQRGVFQRQSRGRIERQRHRYGPEGQDWTDIVVHYRGVQSR